MKRRGSKLCGEDTTLLTLEFLLTFFKSECFLGQHLGNDEG